MSMFSRYFFERISLIKYFKQITLEAMRSDIDEVSLQGIEFWSNVSDEEVDLAIEASEAAESHEPPSRSSRFYAKGALQYLVPILLQKLTQQVITANFSSTIPNSIPKSKSFHFRMKWTTTTNGIQAKQLEFV